jgi:HPt (histidine-containing phosphotransfer) domain-containing protein
MNDHVAKPIDPDLLFTALTTWITPGIRTSPVADLADRAAKAQTQRSVPDSLPDSLPGIDKATAMQRLGGNTVALRQILLNFLHDHHDDAQNIRRALETGDLPLAKRIVHTLKGIAGSIGATEVQPAATALDTALAQGTSDSYGQLLEEQESTLALVTRGLTHLVEHDARDNVIDATVGTMNIEAVLPLLADEEGSVREERRLVDQVRKVLQDEGLPISVSCIQSPVFYGQAQVVHLEALRPISADEARGELENCEDIQLSEEDDYPTQVSDASGSEVLSIGCVRNDYGIPEVLQFWSVADNIRFGGALMAIETAERLLQEQLY